MIVLFPVALRFMNARLTMAELGGERAMNTLYTLALNKGQLDDYGKAGILIASFLSAFCELKKSLQPSRAFSQLR